MQSERPLRVFISYARRDSADFADDLFQGLEVAGFDPILDRHDIAAGENWEDRLSNLIQSADTLLFIITPASVASERCKWEVERASALSKRILPVVLLDVPEASIPDLLRRRNFIFFTAGNRFVNKLGELATALRTDVDWLREHTRLGELAARWRAKGEPAFMLLAGADLEAARAWLSSWAAGAPAPTDLHNEFITRSAQEHDAFVLRERQKRRRTIVTLAAATAIFAIMGAVAASLGFVAQSQAKLAESAKLGALQSLRVAEQQKKIAQDSLARVEATERKRRRLDLLRTDVIDGIRDLLDRPSIDRGDLALMVSAMDSGLSWNAAKMIADFEVGSRSKYERDMSKPRYPGGMSGVMIGIGFDLGFSDRAELRSDWQGLLPDQTIERLEKVTGVRGERARDVLATLAGIEIPFEAAAVANGRSLRRIAARSDLFFANSDELHPDSYGALVALFANRGPGIGNSDRRREMLNILEHMKTRQFNLIPAEIRSMKRLWEGDPKAQGLLKRREMEAVLFELGLQKMAEADASADDAAH